MRVIILGIACISFLAGSETVTDSINGLIWQDNTDVKSIRKNFQEAKAYCETLNLEGMRGWRLPSVKELQSIIDITRAEPTIKNTFSNVDSIGYYWSSTPYAPDNTYAWSVYFYDGKTEKADKTQKGFIRCVKNK